MKCCGEEMRMVIREDMPGYFYICDHCFTIYCPEPSLRVSEIGR